MPSLAARTPTVDELPEPERQLLDGFRHFRSALAAGNPANVVAAETAFLELAQAVCDMARTPHAACRGALVGHAGGQSMEGNEDRQEETQGASDQADGATGETNAGATEEPAAGDDAKKDDE